MIGKRGLRALVAACCMAIAALGARAAPAPRPAAQGPDWTDATRATFYSRDQGSRLIPLGWLAALKEADGTSFIAALPRYGYLSNPFAATADGLPIGFTQAATPRGVVAGLTCAACHVREIEAGGETWRVDGAPANADIGAFLADLDAAVARVLASDDAFAPFATAVLGDDARDATMREILKVDVQFWSTRFHVLVAGTLPTAHPWGPMRLDAFAMIFNAVAGLPLGPPPTYLLPQNIQPGNAPVRSPVLWDADRQDRTQWTGVAANGTRPLALARSISEVFGTFGRFRPVTTPGALGALDRDYLLHNTVDFAGLDDIGAAIEKLGPPVWPWPVDQALADKGKVVFARETAAGGCIACHGETRGAIVGTWKTPLVDVGTDHAAWRVLTRTVDTGSMAGASIPGRIAPLQPRDQAVNLLRISVAGTLIGREAQTALKSPVSSLVRGLFTSSAESGMGGPAPVANAYEARVLHGIWAAAPYLHDGSVPSLADLLEPAAARPKTFAIGKAYDTTRIGLAAAQPTGAFTFTATGCDDLASSRSDCGHDYGTRLSNEDKKALLEYLKTL